jgi:hypothetical protein
MALLGGEFFFPLSRSYWASKNREFDADLKNPTVPEWQNASQKS